MFSQCQPHHARTLAPLQDSPRVRVSYTAEVTVPEDLTAVMSAGSAGVRPGPGARQPHLPLRHAPAHSHLPHRPRRGRPGEPGREPAVPDLGRARDGGQGRLGVRGHRRHDRHRRGALRTLRVGPLRHARPPSRLPLWRDGEPPAHVPHAHAPRRRPLPGGRRGARAGPLLDGQPRHQRHHERLLAQRGLHRLGRAPHPRGAPRRGTRGHVVGHREDWPGRGFRPVRRRLALHPAEDRPLGRGPRLHVLRGALREGRALRGAAREDRGPREIRQVHPASTSTASASPPSPPRSSRSSSRPCCRAWPAWWEPRRGSMRRGAPRQLARLRAPAIWPTSRRSPPVGSRGEPSLRKAESDSGTPDHTLVYLQGLPRALSRRRLRLARRDLRPHGPGNYEILVEWLTIAAASDYQPTFARIREVLTRSAG